MNTADPFSHTECGERSPGVAGRERPQAARMAANKKDRIVKEQAVAAGKPAATAFGVRLQRQLRQGEGALTAG